MGHKVVHSPTILLQVIGETVQIEKDTKDEKVSKEEKVSDSDEKVQKDYVIVGAVSARPQSTIRPIDLI